MHCKHHVCNLQCRGENGGFIGAFSARSETDLVHFALPYYCWCVGLDLLCFVCNLISCWLFLSFLALCRNAFQISV